jgi:hypothetical protein
MRTQEKHAETRYTHTRTPHNAAMDCVHTCNIICPAHYEQRTQELSRRLGHQSRPHIHIMFNPRPLMPSTSQSLLEGSPLHQFTRSTFFFVTFQVGASPDRSQTATSSRATAWPPTNSAGRGTCENKGATTEQYTIVNSISIGCGHVTLHK